MATMISSLIYSLPRDLIEEIISRVPLRSMKAVRLTCKTWNSLSKSESFTKMHIGKAAIREEKAMIIAVMPHNLYSMTVDVDDVELSLKLKGKLSLLDKQVIIFQVMHCEGLLLCILKDATRIVVWNPYLGQTRWIELRGLRHSNPPYRGDTFSYALGYEDKRSGRSIKVLRFFDNFQPKLQYFCYEIYDFESCLWTSLDVTPYWILSSSIRGTSLKGNTYWPTRKRSSGITYDQYIICFDFTRERFGPLLPLPVDGYVYVTLSCFKEEKLAALYQHGRSYENEFEIWITTKIEVETVTWSKFLKMDTRPKIEVPVSFFIDEEKKIFKGFFDDRDDLPKIIIDIFINMVRDVMYLKKLDFELPEGRYSWPPVCCYVPSLVQIKKPARGRLVKQSSLEKRRFAQNMLRLGAFEKASLEASMEERKRLYD